MRVGIILFLTPLIKTMHLNNFIEKEEREPLLEKKSTSPSPFHSLTSLQEQRPLFFFLFSFPLPLLLLLPSPVFICPLFIPVR